jgi:phenylalanyl-tRNA synthetase beta chain
MLLNQFVTLPQKPDSQHRSRTQPSTSPFDLELLEDILTRQGFEVEGKTHRGKGLEQVLVGRIVDAKPHPQADKLQVCQVEAGGGVTRQIVCGAPNARNGLYVAVALPGATLPNGTCISATTIRGVASGGMLCSREELGLPLTKSDGSGIWELEEDAACGRPARELEPHLGEPVFEALGLADTILDISVTPNRPDALCHLGIAREIFVGLRTAGLKPTWNGLSWLHGIATQQIDPHLALEQADQAFKATSATKDSAPMLFSDGASFVAKNALGIRAYFEGFEGLQPRPSPGWLRRTLESLGQNSINDVVDLSNVILLCTGQPSHAFDFDKLRRDGDGAQLELRRAEAAEPFTGLDGKDRNLHPDDCVVSGQPVSLGKQTGSARAEALLGVIGGEHSKVETFSKRIVVEWANPDPVAVRRTSRRIGRKTDSGFQFEKGLDRAGRLYASTLFRELLGVLQPGSKFVGMCGWPDQPNELAAAFPSLSHHQNIAGSLKSSWQTNDGAPFPCIPFTQNCLEAFVGRGVGGKPLSPWSQQLKILSRLGFRFFDGKEKDHRTAKEVDVSSATALVSVAVLAPHWRHLDMDGPADLAEEIIRVIGIDVVAGEPVQGPLEARPDDSHLAFLESCAAGMTHLGYTEVTSFHFMREDDWKRLGFKHTDAIGPAVRIANPIIQDEPLLHTTLLPDLLRKAAHNLNRGCSAGRMFHICRTFQNLDASGNVVFSGAGAQESVPGTDAWRATSYDPAYGLTTSFESNATCRPTETPRLGFLVFGPKQARSWTQPQEEDWRLHDLMAQLRDLAGGFGCRLVFEPLPQSDPWQAALHPGQSARVDVISPDGNSVNLGWVAQIHPRTLRSYDISSQVFAAEINLATLMGAQRSGRNRDLPEHRPHRLPAVRRDFAFVVAQNVTASDIESQVKVLFGGIVSTLPKEQFCTISGFKVFDVYTGEKVPKGTKSIAFEVVIEPRQESLSDEGIQKISKGLVEGLERNLNALLRL